MTDDAFELSEAIRQGFRDAGLKRYEVHFHEIDAADEGRRVDLALEAGDTLYGRADARYAGVLAGRRAAVDAECPFEGKGLAAAWRTGRAVAVEAAKSRARRGLAEADRIAGTDARRRPRADLDG